MTRYRHGWVVALVTAMALVAASCSDDGGGDAESSTAPVMWHAQTEREGPAGSAEATLTRTDDGVSVEFVADELETDVAYTLWWVVIDDPTACEASPCEPPDVLGNADTKSQITYAAGLVADDASETLSASLDTGALDAGWLPDRTFEAPRTAEIHLVLNSHGPVIDGQSDEMISTYRAGCTDDSLPPPFPDTARADGTPGPNACQLYQVAIFAPPA